MKTIKLTQDKVALVDNADFAAVSKFKWHAHKDNGTFYAMRNLRKPDGERTTQHMHQFLFPGKRMDHRDGDGLNNQRANLRPASTRQNSQGARHKPVRSSSKFRGVSLNKTTLKWRSAIQVNGKLKRPGDFDNELRAARAYDVAAREWFGEFACPNFP